jgi:CubicO group peptidase (beta-lactamase class C family)
MTFGQTGKKIRFLATLIFFVGLTLFVPWFLAQALAQLAAPDWPEGADPALVKSLDDILRVATERGQLAGVVLLVYKDGAPVYEGAAGWADLEANQPMRTDTLFRLASVSKAYTTMAAGALISQGVLELDSRVSRYLAAFGESNLDLKDKRAQMITTRHLLNHQAGLTYVFNEKPGGPYHAAGVSDGCDSRPGLSLEENLFRIAKAPLLYSPGAGYSYSVASDALGAVVASAYGKSFPEAMEDLVLKPLGIEDTGFIAKNPEKLSAHYRSHLSGIKRMVEPEKFNLGRGRTLTLSPQRATDPSAFPSGGCGLVGSAPSLMALLEAIRLDGGGLVDPKVMEIFYQDAISPHKSSPGEGFGASWAVALTPSVAKLPVSQGTIHWGGVYGHNWYVDRKNALSIALLTNTALGGLSGPVKKKVLNAVYTAYPAN